MAEEKMTREELYSLYYEKVRRYMCAKAKERDAEDLTSAVFVKVFAKLDSFDGEKASLSTWIYTIARNTVTDFYRTSKTVEALPEEIEEVYSLEEAILYKEKLNLLADALERLDLRSRDLLILHYYSGISLKEIGQRMGISYSYVKVLHREALRSLRLWLEN